jgi:hypothetical protein
MDSCGICEESLANGQWVCKRGLMDGCDRAFLSLRWCEHAGLGMMGFWVLGNEFEGITGRCDGMASKGPGNGHDTAMNCSVVVVMVLWAR